MVGLDIEAIALELAMREDGEIPPTQVLPVSDEDKANHLKVQRNKSATSRHSVAPKKSESLQLN